MLREKLTKTKYSEGAISKLGVIRNYIKMNYDTIIEKIQYHNYTKKTLYDMFMKELKSLGKIVEKYSYPTFNNAVDAEIPNYSQLRKERHGLMAQKAQEEAAKERANNPDDEMDLLRDFIEHPEKIIAARAKAAEAKAKAQDTPSK